MVKIRGVKKLQKDVGNDPIIKDQMTNLGFLLMCNFSNFIVSASVVAKTVSNSNLANEDEGYENH